MSEGCFSRLGELFEDFSGVFVPEGFSVWCMGVFKDISVAGVFEAVFRLIPRFS